MGILGGGGGVGWVGVIQPLPTPTPPPPLFFLSLPTRHMHTGASGGYPARSPARAPIDSCPYLAGPRAPQGFPMRQENDIRVNSRVAISPPLVLLSPKPASPPPALPALGWRWRLCGFDDGRAVGANRPSLPGRLGKGGRGGVWKGRWADGGVGVGVRVKAWSPYSF